MLNFYCLTFSSLIFFLNLKKLNLSLLASEFNYFFSISFGVCLYVSNDKLFIFSTDFFYYFVQILFFDSRFSIALYLNIILFNSLNFCSATNDFPLLISVKTMPTLNFFIQIKYFLLLKFLVSFKACFLTFCFTFNFLTKKIPFCLK